MSDNQIPGMIFRPCFMTEEEFEQGMRTTDAWTEEGFLDAYRKYMVFMGLVADCAKIYILKNYGAVKSWKDLDVKVKHGPTGKVADYYNHEKRVEKITKRKEKIESSKGAREHRSKILDDMLKRIEKKNRKRHNPISSLTEVVLDPTDGDFSLTINGNQHWWIGDEEIIIIADYIENQLKIQNGANQEN